MTDVLEPVNTYCNSANPAVTQGSVTGQSLRKSTVLLGIGTAVPDHAASQEISCGFMQRALESAGLATSRETAFLKRLYKNTAIHRRHSVIKDYVRADAADNTFFPPNDALEPFPSTAMRMAKYEEHAVDLAAIAAKRAIGAAGIDPGEISHIVISTCTGFFAPGPDVLLLRKLDLPTTTARTVLGFMGCYAGLSGLRTCREITQADPDAIVLQIAVELCSLHYQRSTDPDAMVANAIFSDGAAAAIWANGNGEAAANGSPTATVLATHSDISADTIEHMSWRIGDHGFIMTLDAGIPEVLRSAARPFVEKLAETGNITIQDIDGWAVHPGGRKIVEAIQEALNLTSEDVAESMNVLRDFGNMSSATILFVLQEELKRRAAGDIVAAMGFGPGLTMEGALLGKL